MSQPVWKGKGKEKERSPSPLRHEVPQDPDAPIPSIEPTAQGQSDPAPAIAMLPFFDNFGDLIGGALRFPNIVDVRNRQNFAREASADFSKDPFETRIIMNGVCLNDVWQSTTPDRPPFFDVEWTKTTDELTAMMREYFPGVNLYPELRKPAGSMNLMGQHWAFLALDLYDTEGMLQRCEELRTRHVMALLTWQLLDFQDIVFLVKEPLHHDRTPGNRYRWRELTDDQRFIVLPIHMPNHWVVAIFDRMDNHCIMWNSTSPGIMENKGNQDAAAVVNKYLLAALGDEVRDFDGTFAPGTSQIDGVSCGWHVAEFVRNFFRENRGKGSWLQRDWAKSSLIRTAPRGMEPATASIATWMFAIRSELNGTGEAIRTPVAVPVVGVDGMRAIKDRYGLLTQREVINQRLFDSQYAEIAAGQKKGPREMTPGMRIGLTTRFQLSDMQRGIDFRTSRSQPSPTPIATTYTPLNAAQEILKLAKKTRLSMHRDLSRSPLPIMDMDGTWSVPARPMQSGERTGLPRDDSRGSRVSQLSDQMQGMDIGSEGPARSRSGSQDSRHASPNIPIRRENRWASHFVEVSESLVPVPMPTIRSDFRGWEDVISRHAAKKAAKATGPSTEEQNRQRDQRAKDRKWKQ